jgi:hypothetical protein
MRRMGIEPGKSFAFDKAWLEIHRTLTEAASATLPKIKTQFLKAGVANDRYALGDHDKRSFNPDGSLDLHPA